MTSYYEVFEVHQVVEEDSNQGPGSSGEPGREVWDDWDQRPGSADWWNEPSFQASHSHGWGSWYADRSWSAQWSGWGRRNYEL